MLATYRTLTEQLEKHYTLFIVNRKYKDIHWAGKPEEYLAEQQKVAEEISKLSKRVEEKIKADMATFWPDLEVVAYDSRTFSLADDRLGAILVQGLKKQSECLDVEAVFQSQTGYKLTVTRIEDLDEETRRKVEEAVEGEEKSNGQREEGRV